MTTNTAFMNFKLKFPTCFKINSRQRKQFFELVILFLLMPLVAGAQTFSEAPVFSNTTLSASTNQSSETSIGVTPKILNVSMINIGGDCNDKDTETGNDDVYTGMVTITFEEMPTSGAIQISGGTDYQFDFEADNDGQTAFSFSLEFPADGERLELVVDYVSKETNRFIYQSAKAAPKSCSTSIAGRFDSTPY